MHKDKKFPALIAEELERNESFRQAVQSGLTAPLTLVPVAVVPAVDVRYRRLEPHETIKAGDQFCTVLRDGTLRKRGDHEDWMVVSASVGKLVSSRTRSVFRRAVSE